MGQLLVTFFLVGTLGVSSVVFAEAIWYGSLRAGVESSDGSISIKDGGSRWGIKGSTEAGEGLTAVHRFEHEISTEDAGQPKGRLSYVGLSGRYGTLTVGRIWSASYNAFSVIVDNSLYYFHEDTLHQYVSAVSYALSNNLLSFQLDAVYGQENAFHTEDDPDNDLEAVEFGVTVNVGKTGKVAVAYINDKYVKLNPVFGVSGTWKSKTAYAAAEITVSDLVVYAGYRKLRLIQKEGLLRVAPQTTRYFGFRGGLGNTGIQYLFQVRKKMGTATPPSKPWVFGLSKSLGGGASIHFEHSDAARDPFSVSATQVGLTVDF